MSIIKKVKISFKLICLIIPLFFEPIILITLTKVLKTSLLRLVLVTKILSFALICFKTKFLKTKNRIIL